MLILNRGKESYKLSISKFNVLQSAYYKIRQYAIVFIVIFLASWLCFALSQALGYYVVAFILLILVSILATLFKTGPVLLASILSILIWNFFFIPPHHTFHIEKTEDILMFGMFGVVVIMNGIFTTRVRRQEKLARQREVHTNALFQLTRELSKAMGAEEVGRIAVTEIQRHFGLGSVIIPKSTGTALIPEEEAIQRLGLPAGEYRIADWAYKSGKKAGRFTAEFSNAAYTFFPLQGTAINPGVIALKMQEVFSPETALFWETFMAQISNALEREFLAELARKAKFLDESDRFYKTLFNSVSHELRIPVATILAASDALNSVSNQGGMQTALSTEIYMASLRLNRLIENLLNMSRLESGRIALRLDWFDVSDLINKVLNDLKEDLKVFTVLIDIPDNFPLVRIDFGLMEQVLYNLVLNSCQYAPAMSEVRISALYGEGLLNISVKDRGPGFPADSLENVFNKFFRVNDKVAGGLGLGLSIVKGFTEAHKGSVVAENRSGGGASVTVSIPSQVLYVKDLSIDKSDA
jgi:two-component system sensor histidine kinase KdpD